MIEIHETEYSVNAVNCNSAQDDVIDLERTSKPPVDIFSPVCSGREEFYSLSCVLQQREQEVDLLEKRVSELLHERTVCGSNLRTSVTDSVIDFEGRVDELRREVLSKDVQISDLKGMISHASSSASTQTTFPSAAIQPILPNVAVEMPIRMQIVPQTFCKCTQVSDNRIALLEAKFAKAKKCIQKKLGANQTSVAVQTHAPLLEGAALARVLQDQLFRAQDELHKAKREFLLSIATRVDDTPIFRNRVLELEFDNAVLSANLERKQIPLLPKVMPSRTSQRDKKLIAEMDALILKLKSENERLKRTNCVKPSRQSAPAEKKNTRLEVKEIGINTIGDDAFDKVVRENTQLRKDLAALDDDQFWADLETLQTQHSQCVGLLTRLSKVLPADLSREITDTLRKLV